MGLFDAIPIRDNGLTEVDASWWNSIRTALINAFGDQINAQTPFTIADDQSSLADIAGLVFDEAEVIFFKMRYSIFRTDGSSPRRETGIFEAAWDEATSSWLYKREAISGNALNMGADSLQITAAGQVQYKSDSMGGTYSGTIVYKILETLAA